MLSLALNRDGLQEITDVANVITSQDYVPKREGGREWIGKAEEDERVEGRGQGRVKKRDGKWRDVMKSMQTEGVLWDLAP